MNDRRFAALDSWRGVCALLVAVHNFELPSTAFVMHSSLFVDFFFVLSGFVITHAYMDRLATAREAGAFIVRRFGRLWPLHVVILMTFVSMALLKFLATRLLHLPFDAHLSDPYMLRGAITNLFLVQTIDPVSQLSWNSPSWSISTEFWTYLLFAAVCMASRNRRPAPLLAGAIVLAAGVVLVLFSPQVLESSRDYAFFRCFYGFFAGHLVYRLWDAFPQTHKSGAALEILAVILVIVFVQFVGISILSMAAPLVFGFAVWVFAQEKGSLSNALKTPPFLFLGTCSYSIYMVHWRLVDVLHRYGGISWHSMPNQVALIALIVGYLAAVVALSAVTYRWIEQPGRRYFNRLSDKILLADGRPAGAKHDAKNFV